MKKLAAAGVINRNVKRVFGVILTPNALFSFFFISNSG